MRQYHLQPHVLLKKIRVKCQFRCAFQLGLIVPQSMTHAKTFVWGRGKTHVNFAYKRDVFEGSILLEQKDLEILGLFE